MGNKSSKRSDSKVVIVGGGYAGSAIAVNLDKFCHVTLIDPKTYLHHCIGSLRAAVTTAGFEKKVMIPYAPAISNGVITQGLVISVDTATKCVTLQSEETISYDYLVFSCGSSNNFPGKLPLGSSEEDAKQLYEEFRKQVKESKTIVIIGGGPIGVELAGEISSEYGDKSIHIIHSQDVLADPSLSAKFHRNLLAAVQSKGIKVIFGEKVNLAELDFQPGIGWLAGPLTVKTNKETSIEADMIVKCIGNKINNEAYQSSLSDHVDEKNQLKVNEYFQVEGFENVFAVGDCCNGKEIKEAYVAGLHADHLSGNIRRLNDNKPLKCYKAGRSAMIVPVGKDGGVTELPNGMVLGNFATKKIKSERLLIPDFWKKMKQSVPQ